VPNVSENELVHSRRRPRFGKIPAAVAYSGVSRTVLYEMREDTPGLFRKNGKATLVDFDVLDELLDRLPIAERKTRIAADAPRFGRRHVYDASAPGAPEGTNIDCGLGPDESDRLKKKRG
jgi:hypothetical protein